MISTGLVFWLLAGNIIFGWLDMPRITPPDSWIFWVGLVIIGIPLSAVIMVLGFHWMAIMGEGLEVLDDHTWDLAERHFPKNPDLAAKIMKAGQVVFFLPLILALLGSFMTSNE